MPRTKRIRKYYKKKNKYNIETNPKTFPGDGWVAPATETAFDRSYNEVIVAASDTEGVRKVKNLTVSVAFNGYGANNTTFNNPIYWALVYVPEGTQPNYLNDVGDLYQPSQWVLSSGILQINEGKSRIYTPLSKNLNKGDRICLCLGANSTTPPTISALVRYAICFN